MIRDPPVVSVFDVYLLRLAKCTGYVVPEEEFLGACVCVCVCVCVGGGLV